MLFREQNLSEQDGSARVCAFSALCLCLLSSAWERVVPSCNNTTRFCLSIEAFFTYEGRREDKSASKERFWRRFDGEV